MRAKALQLVDEDSVDVVVGTAGSRARIGRRLIGPFLARRCLLGGLDIDRLEHRIGVRPARQPYSATGFGSAHDAAENVAAQRLAGRWRSTVRRKEYENRH
jgi:hypothetical protein